MRLAPLCTGLALMAAAPAALAQTDETLSYPEIAAAACAEEWEALVEKAPDTWTEHGEVTLDPAIAPETTEAFNKYAAAAIATADYFGVFLGLAEEENQTAGYMELTEARFDLAMCLMPTEAERDRVVALMGENSDLPEPEIREALFEPFDRFTCMGVDVASEEVLELDPEDPGFAEDFSRIVSTSMTSCD